MITDDIGSRLKPDEADRLVAELPNHLKAMVVFSLHTGPRKANVVGLQWPQVDLIRRCAWVHADQAKARSPLFVLLTVTAIEDVRHALFLPRSNLTNERDFPYLKRAHSPHGRLRKPRSASMDCRKRC